MWPFRPAPTPSEAARTLGAIALKNAADRRAATLNALRECVATGRVAKLGWRS
jgi:hypothetical protein